MPLDPTQPVDHLSPRARELLSESFANEEHMSEFAEALALSDLYDPEVTPSGMNSAGPQSPHIPDSDASVKQSGKEVTNTLNGGGRHTAARERRSSMASVHGWEKVEKVKALSDFAPIHTKVSKKSTVHVARQGWSYHLARWPLLGLIFAVIYLEFGLYVFTRQIVNTWEFLVSLISRPHQRLLRRRLRSAKTWHEWRDAALEMDAYLGFDAWKAIDEDNKYDYPLVRKVKKSLKSLREHGDVKGVMGVLEICLRNNFAGTESVRMYSETFFGTKRLIESYTDEVAAALEFVRASDQVPLSEKRRFYRAINKNYGASALCLSGGAGFGYYHFGVIKAFLDADLLPRVITGTSAGGLVSALTCTRTDEELREMLVPELADHITACEDNISVWMRRFIKTGARFDAVSWARKASFFTRGSMTFREAYERTGRALNVSVIPHDQHSPTKLLNYLTAPDCVIWSAIIASAAVPGILNGVVLMQKTPKGDLKPMNFGSKFKDGSLRVDIPLESLHLLFNVNYSIVSQVNPHVHLFFFAPRGSVGRPVEHRKGQGWRGGFLLSAAEQYLKLELTKNFRVIRDLELLPQLLGSDWSSVFLQRFAGSVTILPKSRNADWLHLLTDPDRKELERMLRVGESVAWPKLHMIDNRLKVERSILRGRSEVRQAIHKSRITTDSDSAVRAKRIENTAVPKARYIPLESDAEKGFASRSKVMKRTLGSSRLRLNPAGSAEHEENILRRRRGKTASPTMESSLSRVHRNQLEELLVHGEDSHESSSDKDDNAHPRYLSVDNLTAEPERGLQRSKSLSTGFSFPSFGYRRSSQPPSPTETQKVLSGNGANSSQSSPREIAKSRLARWLSPHVEESAVQVHQERDASSGTYTSDEEDDPPEVQALEEEGREIAEQDFASEDDEDERAFGTTISDDDSNFSDGEVTVTGERVTRPEVRESAAEGF